MSTHGQDRASSLVILTGTGELPAGVRVWGTGGWLPPSERSALDWLTLTRLLGWRARIAPIAGDALERDLGPPLRHLILASECRQAHQPLVDAIARSLEREPALVIAPAAEGGSPLASVAAAARESAGMTGQDLRWIGPGAAQRWICRRSMEAAPLEVTAGAEVWATLEGAPIVTARRLGAGRIATLGFDPSAARDTTGAATALLSRLLVRGSPEPTAWLDLEGALVLRMDDPGGAQNVHSRRWCYDKLAEPQWAEIGGELARRRGRLSIGYVSAWVDDGDARRGELAVGGKAVARVPGAVHPSPDVQYRDLAGNSPGAVSDYASEYRGIHDLVRRELASVELHGYTHQHPDVTKWARATDRYDAVDWYRELGEAASNALAGLPLSSHPIALGREAIHRYFGKYPTTLICPGDAWTTSALEVALDLGLDLVSSYYLALRIEGRFCWSQQVCAPYLDQPDAAYFDAALPVVGYFHDLELSRNGASWLARWLDAWAAAGATRLIDLQELASALATPIHLERDPWRLWVGDGAAARTRPFQVRIWSGSASLPSEVALSDGRTETLLVVEGCDDGSGRVRIPTTHGDELDERADER